MGKGTLISIVSGLTGSLLFVALYGCENKPYGESNTNVEDIVLPPRDSGARGESDSGNGGQATPPLPDDKPPTAPTVDGGVGGLPKSPDAGMGPCPNPDGKMISFLWKAPAPKVVPPASPPCSAGDIGYVEGLINAKDSTYVSIETAMRARNVNCASCLFSIQDDSQWGPFVYYTSDKTKGAFYNNGACYARVSNKTACGDEIQQYFYCLEEVCSFCGTDAERAACEDTAKQDTKKCGRFDFASCPSSLTQVNDVCYTTWEKALTAVCGQ
jgi:hypothetical protein